MRSSVQYIVTAAKKTPDVASAQNRIRCIQIGNRCLLSGGIYFNLSHYIPTFYFPL